MNITSLLLSLSIMTIVMLWRLCIVHVHVECTLQPQNLPPPPPPPPCASILVCIDTHHSLSKGAKEGNGEGNLKGEWMGRVCVVFKRDKGDG